MSDKSIHDLSMTPDQMHRLASRATEILVDRITNLREQRPWEGEFRDVLEDQIGGPAPEGGRPLDDLVEQIVRDVLHNNARQDHPRFFGFVPAVPTWPSIIADYLVSGFNVHVGTWLGGSGGSQVELTVTSWLCDWLGYDSQAGGLMTSGASAASVEALVAAREYAGHPDAPVVYMSDQSHSALPKAAYIAGVRREHIRLIDTDRQYRIDVQKLSDEIQQDRKAGLNPLAVCANAGTSSTGSIDPLLELADFCTSEGIWLHIDAAYGGFTVLTPEGKELLKGIERADSVSMDGHKWFFQPYETGILLVRNLDHLEAAFATGHDVIQDTVWGANHPNFADRGLQLSRFARALKIWMSVEMFGLSKFRAAIQHGLDLTKQAHAFIEQHPQLEVMAPTTLSIVCFRIRPNDRTYSEEELEELNRVVLAQVFWDDETFISSTSLKGVFTLRLCILNFATTWQDVRDTLELACRFGLDAAKKGG
ncbi:MAG: aminotransferase class V-fold PLP-dependent enzyme [Gammaproteobacteria bacterium]|nr:aminotransferase class V-fold PLP-dependent enzyme [Gammaproteobacteria bacterium]